MNWTNVFDPSFMAIDFAVGALAVLIGYLLTFKVRAEKKRTYFAIAIVVSWAVLRVVSDIWAKPQLKRASIGKELRALPTYVALERHEPAVFRQIVDKVMEIQEQGKTRQDAVSIVRPLLVEAIKRNSAKASDEVVLNLSKFTVNLIETLEKDGTDRCFRLLYARPGEPDLLSDEFPKGMAENESAVQAEVIRSGSMNEGQPMAPEQADALIGELLAALAADHGEAASVLAKTSEPDVDRQMACRMTAALFTKMIELPPDKGPALLRYMFGPQ